MKKTKNKKKETIAKKKKKIINEYTKNISKGNLENKWRIEEVDPIGYNLSDFIDACAKNSIRDMPQEYANFIKKLAQHGEMTLVQPLILNGEEEEEREQDFEVQEIDDNGTDDDDDDAFVLTPENRHKDPKIKRWEEEWENSWVHGEGEKDSMFDGYFSYVALEQNKKDIDVNDNEKRKRRGKKRRKLYHGYTDLIKNGRNILVTDKNKTEYIKLYVNYKYKQLVQKKVKFFAKGINDVFPLHLLKMFTPQELSAMISGDDRCFDVEDMKRHVIYCGYTIDSQTIINLYEILEEFTPEQKSLFLMFVTSCSRPPLLGFKELVPKLCVTKCPLTNCLPSASTCVNLLKLPDYNTKEELRTKLLKAIYETDGFDLQ